MTRGSAARVLILSRQDRGMEAAHHILQAAGHHVTELHDTAEVFRWLRLHRAEIVVVDLPVEEQSEAALVELFTVLRQTTGTDILALIRATAARGPQARSLFHDHRLSHFLAVGGDGSIDPIALTTTVSKIVTQDI